MPKNNRMWRKNKRICRPEYHEKHKKRRPERFWEDLSQRNPKIKPTQECHSICGSQAECKKIIQKNTTKYMRKKCHPEFSSCYNHLLFFTELQTTTGSLKRLFNWSFQFEHIEHVTFAFWNRGIVNAIEHFTFAFWNVTDMSENFQEIFRRNVKQNARECQKEFQKGCQKKRQTEFQEQCQKGSQKEFPKQSRKLVKNKSEQNTSNQFLKWFFWNENYI